VSAASPVVRRVPGCNLPSFLTDSWLGCGSSALQSIRWQAAPLSVRRVPQDQVSQSRALRAFDFPAGYGKQTGVYRAPRSRPKTGGPGRETDVGTSLGIARPAARRSDAGFGSRAGIPPPIASGGSERPPSFALFAAFGGAGAWFWMI